MVSSGVVVDTDAWFVTLPVAVAFTVISKEELVPFEISGSRQVNVPELSVHESESDTYCTPDGKTSVTVTSCAVALPELKTVMV